MKTTPRKHRVTFWTHPDWDHQTVVIPGLAKTTRRIAAQFVEPRRRRLLKHSSGLMTAKAIRELPEGCF